MRRVGALERFELRPQAPFRLDLTVWVLRRRKHNAIDRFEGGCYRRVLMLGGRPVEVAVRQVGPPDVPRLTVELRTARRGLDERATIECQGALGRLLGLEVDLSGFYRLARGDAQLDRLAQRFSGMRPPRFPSTFEAVINAIACQQLSLVVGIHLLNRLTERFGPTVSRAPGAFHGFPTPEQLADAELEDLRELGFSRAKSRAISDLARQLTSGDLDLEALQGEEDARALGRLQALRGVGRWSAEYTLLRGLGRWNVLPGDDVGARNNLQRRFGLEIPPDYAAIHALSQIWAPYGGLVYFHLLLDALAEDGFLAPNIVSNMPTGQRRTPGPRQLT